MGVIEIGALVLTGAGTLGSVLGLFYSYASKENGKLTRAMMKESDDETRKLIGMMHEDNKRFHEDNQRFHEDNKRFHEENKALLSTLVGLLQKNGGGR